MEKANTCYVLVVVPMIVCVLWAPCSGVLATSHDDRQEMKDSLNKERHSYIVYMDTTRKPDEFSLEKHWYASMINEASGSKLLDRMATTLLLYVYDTVLYGFAAKLTATEAAALKNMDGCLGVIADSIDVLQTTRTPQFLGLNTSHGLWPDSNFGDDIIIGVLDTGIWPERESFSDAGLQPVPERWKGKCEVGTNFSVSNCNRKLIGARYFLKGFEAIYGPIDETEDFKSPRDLNGHGSHTASIAAGSKVPRASLFGFANGTARGIAKKARLAVYKVCWLKRHNPSCSYADIAAGIDKAVSDGVDLISVSIGGVNKFPYYNDSTAIAALGAIRKGVFVSFSACNDGPSPSLICNTAPWITTVGASTIDRDFPATVMLGINDENYTGSASLWKGNIEQLPLEYEKAVASINGTGNQAANLDPANSVSGEVVPYPSFIHNTAQWITTASVVLGNDEINTGFSLLKRKVQPFPLVYGKTASSSNETASRLCLNGTLDRNMVRGQVVLCDRGSGNTVAKGLVVKQAFGVGMILANGRVHGEESQASCHFLPALSVGYSDGEKIKAYINETENPTAAIIAKGETVIGKARAPIVATFSSRGPNPIVPEILKPDMVAPGVNILAAWSGASGPTGLISDERRVEYNIESGTSMACPHVTGIAALLRAVHPKWTPAAIKSALMTSSGLLDNKNGSIGDWALTPIGPANAFALGAGHVNASAAVDPGLVYDLVIDDYIRFFCSLNYTESQIYILTQEKISCPQNSTLQPGDLNYPSFSVVFTPRNLVRVTRRTVTNVGGAPSVYNIAVDNPPNVNVIVEPRRLSFQSQNEKANFTVRFESNLAGYQIEPSGHQEFGQILWKCVKGGTQVVRSPVAIAWKPTDE